MLHVDDAALIRLRDGECDSSEERELRTHLAGCSRCWENAEMINRLADGFFAAVGEIEPSAELRLPRRAEAIRKKQRPTAKVPRLWGKRRSVQVAALIAVVVALTLTTAPARAVVSSGWQALAELLSFRSPPRAVNEPVQDVVHESTQTELREPMNETEFPELSRAASFTPQGEAFFVVITHAQSGGTLSITVDTTRRASVQVFGNADSDELVVFGEGVRILNREVSSASYEFTLPRSLSSIEVRVAGRTVASLSPVDLVGSTPWQLDLADTGRQ